MLQRIVIATCVLCATLAVAQQTLPPAPIKLTWEDMFAPPYEAMPQIALDMDCTSATDCYIAGGSNGVGFGVYKWAGNVNGNVIKMNEPNMSMFVMSLAVGGSTASPKGAFSGIVDFTIGAGLQYLAKNATEWLPSAMPLEIVWAGESMSGNAAGTEFIALGSGFSNGIMRSTDSGVTFANEAINYTPEYPNCSAPGVVFMKSDSAWFMTWGVQPPRKHKHHHHNPTDKDETVIATKKAGHVQIIKNKKTGAIRTEYLSPIEVFTMRKQQSDSKCNFFAGSIAKSTDKGKTWTRQYQSNTYNIDELSCFDDKHCAATGWSATESAVIVTKDGGKTWNVTLVSPAATSTEATSISAVGYATKTEIWAGGSKQTQTSGNGLFWYSVDGGDSWTEFKGVQPNIMAMMSIDFTTDAAGTSIGYASGMTMFKTSTILRYKKQADYGYFTQSHCPFKGCSLLCQNISFPQGMCLTAPGGSAQAFCTPNGIEQLNYDTTSCIGSYNKTVQPINECLKDTQGSYFKNFCPSSSTLPEARVATKKDVLRRV